MAKFNKQIRLMETTKLMETYQELQMEYMKINSRVRSGFAADKYYGRVAFMRKNLARMKSELAKRGIA